MQCKTIVLNLNQINGVDTAVELAAKSQLGRQWLAAKEIIYELQKKSLKSYKNQRKKWFISGWLETLMIAWNQKKRLIKLPELAVGLNIGEHYRTKQSIYFKLIEKGRTEY